jgi:predicted small secreted protein
MKTMKKLCFLVLLAMAVSACNTVHGIGQDIEKGGEIIKDSAK